jgi:hypothetical protein
MDNKSKGVAILKNVKNISDDLIMEGQVIIFTIKDNFTCILESELKKCIGKLLKHETKDIWALFLKIDEENYIKISQNEFYFGKLCRNEAIYDVDNICLWKTENLSLREWNDGFFTSLKKNDTTSKYYLLKRFLLEKKFLTIKELSISLDSNGNQIIHTQKNIQESLMD